MTTENKIETNDIAKNATFLSVKHPRFVTGGAGYQMEFSSISAFKSSGCACQRSIFLIGRSSSDKKVFLTLKGMDEALVSRKKFY